MNAGGGAEISGPTKRSDGVCFGRLSVLAAMHHRINQLPPKQVQRRSAIKLNVVERVRDDLGGPYQARHHVPNKEQLDRAEDQARETDRQPDLAHMIDEVRVP